MRYLVSILLLLALAACGNPPPQTCFNGHLVQEYTHGKITYYVALRDDEGRTYECELKR